MISLIVAHDRNRVIGLNGGMPWNIPGELRRFRSMTTGNAVIMGRRTYESLGKPLPDRLNVVISSRLDFEAPGCLVAHSLQEAIGLCGGHEIFITGGAMVYAQALDLCEKLYITEIDAEFEGDTWFPEFDRDKYIRQVDSLQDGPVPYAYVTYTHK